MERRKLFAKLWTELIVIFLSVFWRHLTMTERRDWSQILLWSMIYLVMWIPVGIIIYGMWCRC
jgi:hypothetical protein